MRSVAEWFWLILFVLIVFLLIGLNLSPRFHTRVVQYRPETDAERVR